jgi:peptidoglycan/LPS O-acetylase OafA/YrhL
METRQRYLMLDGMRGIAAMIVILEHATDLFGSSPFAMGYLAVDLFFVISGFVIAASYDHRLQQGLGPWQFVRIRLIRFYPLYLLGLLVGLALALGDLRSSDSPDAMLGWTAIKLLKSGAYSLFMLPSFVAPHLGPFKSLFPLDPPAWSLFLELMINAVYARFFFRLRNDVITLVMLISIVWLALNAAAIGNLYGGSSWYSALEGVPRVGFSFFAGVLAYRFRAHFSAWGARLPSLFFVVVLVLALFIGPAERNNPWLSLLMVIGVFPPLVGLAASHQPRSGVALYSLLGTCSYAVYILHDPLYDAVRHAVPLLLATPLRAFRPWAGLLFVCTLLPLCYGLDRYYDMPLRRWLTTSTRQTSAIQSQSPG